MILGKGNLEREYDKGKQRVARGDVVKGSTTISSSEAVEIM